MALGRQVKAPSNPPAHPDAREASRSGKRLQSRAGGWER